MRPVVEQPYRPFKAPALLQERGAKSSLREVQFKFDAPAAKSVSVAGTFNNWLPDATLLTRDSKGTWSTEAFLKPGCYEYRFVVDGIWTNDPRAKTIANVYGSTNCVFEVPEAR
jgi:1,4-alpha-glucan branching enzyme